MVVRYFNGFKVTDELLNLNQIEDGTSSTIFKVIMGFFKSHNIPENNLIGFAADNCNVMMGVHDGVQKKLKEIIPNLFVLGCIYHWMHLCASAACMKLPSTIEDLARDIYGYFKNSSKRQGEYKDFQVFLDVSPHKILKLSQTRWLSLESVVNRILEQWDALKNYFEKVSQTDNLQSAKCINNALNCPIYKIYLIFLSFILEIVVKINQLFQSEKPLICNLLTIIEKYYRMIMKCYMKESYLKKISVANVDPADARNFLDIDAIYFGARTETLFSMVSQADLKTFKLRALDFLITLCQEIKKRINFNDPVPNKISILTFHNAIKSETQPSIVPLLECFPNLVSYNELESISSEWRLLREYKEHFLNIGTDEEEFWKKISNIKESENYVFEKISEFAFCTLSLPHSSANTERIFSKLTNLKTKLRICLHITTCNSLIYSKSLLQGMECHS